MAFSVDPCYASIPFSCGKARQALQRREFGAKGNLLNGRVEFGHISVYYIVWDDVQQTGSVLLNGTNTSAQINGQSASGLGVCRRSAGRGADEGPGALSFPETGMVWR